VGATAKSDEPRRSIDRGLEWYRRGDLTAALREWEAALAVDPDSVEARALVEFARGRLEGPQDGADAMQTPEPLRRTAEGGSFSEDWEEPQLTAAELAHETLERVRKAEEAASGGEEDGVVRPMRTTIVSPLSQLLAPLTSPKWPSGESLDGAPVSPVRDDATPATPIVNERTRPVGKDTPVMGARTVPAVREAPSDDAARTARLQAATLIERCRQELRAGRVDDAATAAEQALLEGEEAPPPGIAEVIEPARALFEQVFEAYVGPADDVLEPAISFNELATMKIDSRAGFLFSRVDGASTVDQLIDISGMGRFDALRVLATLLQRGALRRA
jgi:hypothetical protein